MNMIFKKIVWFLTRTDKYIMLAIFSNKRTTKIQQEMNN